MQILHKQGHPYPMDIFLVAYVLCGMNGVLLDCGEHGEVIFIPAEQGNKG